MCRYTFGGCIVAAMKQEAAQPKATSTSIQAASNQQQQPAIIFHLLGYRPPAADREPLHRQMLHWCQWVALITSMGVVQVQLL